MSGHLPAVSRILRKCLSGTEIYSGLFLRDSTKLPVSYNVFCIFFKFFCSSHGSIKLVPVSSCRQPVFGINSPKLLYLCTFSPTYTVSVAILGDCFLVCFQRPCLRGIWILWAMLVMQVQKNPTLVMFSKQSTVVLYKSKGKVKLHFSLCTGG